MRKKTKQLRYLIHIIPIHCPLSSASKPGFILKAPLFWPSVKRTFLLCCYLKNFCYDRENRFNGACLFAQVLVMRMRHVMITFWEGTCSSPISHHLLWSVGSLWLLVYSIGLLFPCSHDCITSALISVNPASGYVSGWNGSFLILFQLVVSAITCLKERKNLCTEYIPLSSNM